MISIPTILEGLEFMHTYTLFVVIFLLFYPRSAVRTGTDLQAAVRTVDEGQEAFMEKLVARKGRVFVMAPDGCGGSRSWFTQEIANWRQRHGLPVRAWPLDDE